MKRIQLIILALFLLPLTSNAGLIGTQVNCSITPTPFWVCDQPSSIIGDGAEFELDVPIVSDSFGFSIDISDTSVLISNIEDNPFTLGAGELLTLAFEGDVFGTSDFVASGVSVVSPSSISFIDNLLSIDLNGGAVWNVGSFVSFNLDVLTSETASVPVPATLVLLVIGLAGIGFSRQKKANYTH